MNRTDELIWDFLRKYFLPYNRFMNFAKEDRAIYWRVLERNWW